MLQNMMLQSMTNISLSRESNLNSDHRLSPPEQHFRVAVWHNRQPERLIWRARGAAIRQLDVVIFDRERDSGLHLIACEEAARAIDIHSVSRTKRGGG